MPADSRAVLGRPVPPPDATVAYGDHPEQVADLRLPVAGGGPPRPLVVVIHGGFWRARWDRTHTGPLAADLAARGYPVAQLEYRRIGQSGGGWPGTLDDVRDGVAALPALFTGTLPGAPVASGPPILVGHSAGGQLALYCAASAPSQVRGVVALAPVADLAEGYRLDLDGGAVAALLGGGPEQVPERYAVADPARRVPVRTRTVILHGALDRHVPPAIARRYAAAAGPGGPAAAGGLDAARGAGGAAGLGGAFAEVTLVELADCDHFALIDPQSPAWPHVLAALRSLD